MKNYAALPILLPAHNKPYALVFLIVIRPDAAFSATKHDKSQLRFFVVGGRASIVTLKSHALQREDGVE